MKKTVMILMLCVFVVTLVGTVMISQAQAKKLSCDRLPCVATILPDGTKYICCEFVFFRNECVIVEEACYYEDPL